MDNVLKDSYLLNLSFSVDNPSEYCDCGTINSWVKNARGRRGYVFPAASPYKVYEFAQKGQLYRIERKVPLSGKVNVTFSEIQKDRTKVKVKTKYVLTRNITSHNVGEEAIGLMKRRMRK
jgi:hypothetical protein